MYSGEGMRVEGWFGERGVGGGGEGEGIAGEG